MADLAYIIQQFGAQLIAKEQLSIQQQKALLNIVRCRTATLGWHEERCDHCAQARYSYNSCGDRHCPKCQNTKQAIWVEDLVNATLPIQHFHVVFTVPHSLNGIYLWNQQLYCQILFKAMWATLHSFGYTHYGVETGCVAILHTWGQNLSLHPHLHCIIPAAGYTLQGKWKSIGKNGRYLFPVNQLSTVFKGKFLDSMSRQLRKLNAFGFNHHLQQADNTDWVVNSEPSLATPDKVMHYLGQYTHRVAISNQRILEVSDTHVRFIAKDYHDKAKKKPVRLQGVEFLRRFCMHVMPKRFVKIRRFGIYNKTVIRNYHLQLKPQTKPDIEAIALKLKPETKTERILRLTGFDCLQCPKCKRGRMVSIKRMPRIRSPAISYRIMLMAEIN
ncbi:IS91 family transposase [Carboxylicivirga marina]|uniref:IS91 family transposase n=1 Tax=Carboxylicivirga marina TaxID=2800988 RepID=UPI002592EE95|nr:transposase [uncultured Carboxylicivirga sp.]